MSIAGKKSVHFVKKDIQSQKTGAIAFKTLAFAHKATAGETGINLLSLSLPSEMAGFVNPTPTELSNAQIRLLRKSLRIVSSLRGELIDFLSYTVNTNTFIGFTDSFGTALQDEIFVCTVNPVTETGSLIADAEFILETGTLSATQTDIVVGKSFKTNLNPSKQLGAVMLFIDGQQWFRNVGNATASPSADGDFQEVDNGFGSSTLLRANVADAVNDRTYLVVSTATTVIRPDGSLRDEIEAQQGTIDTLVDTVAALAGVPESNFQAAPTQPQLQQFGNAVVSLSAPGALGTPKAATVLSQGAVVADKIETRTVAGPISTNLTTLTNFSGLTEGKRYRVIARAGSYVPADNAGTSNFIYVSRSGNTVEVARFGRVADANVDSMTYRSATWVLEIPSLIGTDLFFQYQSNDATGSMSDIQITLIEVNSQIASNFGT